MQTHSSSKFIGESSTNPTSTNLKHRNRRRSKQRFEPIALEETPIVMMADQRTMAELLRAPTEGYAEAIVVPPIPAEHFELKHSLINLVTKQFFGFEKEDPHAHIRYFNKITSTLKYKDVPETSIKLMLSHFLLTDLLRACPHHGFTELHQLDTFYNGLNPFDQDSLNSAAGGNLLERSTQDDLKIIENKLRVWNSRNKPIVSQVKATPAFVKAVGESCVTCGGAHSYRQCPATNGNTFTGYHDNIQGYVSTAVVNNNYNQGYRPQGDPHFHASNQMGPPGFLLFKIIKIVLIKIKANDTLMKNMQTQMTSLTNSNIELKSMFGQFMKMNTASFLGSGSLPSNTVPNPWEDLKAIATRSGATLTRPSVSPPPPPFKEVDQEPETITDQVLTGSTNNVPPLVVQPFSASTSSTPISSPKILELNPHQPSIPYPSSFSEALAHMPKFAKMVKDLLTNKEKLIEVANTLVNDPQKVTLKTQLTLELATWTIAIPAGIAEDVFVQVGKFTFPTDFVVVDYEVDPRVPLILGRIFLRTAHALVDHSDKSIHKIDIIDTTCEDHFHEVLNNHMSGSPTLSPDLMVESLSPSLTPFGDSDFLLEETDAFLSFDYSIPPGIDDDTYDSEVDILFLEKLLNDNPTPDLPPIPYPVCLIDDAEKIKSSINDPPDLELKDLPSHLEYAFLKGTSKLPIIIAKNLKGEEKEQLLKVLKSHKREITWKISDIRGINPNFCTHKILMEDDFKPVIQHQRRVNPKIHQVIKVEVIKLLDAGLI
nr:hypothetical protein [Tanacetum cinerariifolium]